MKKPYAKTAVRTLRAFYTVGELAQLAGVSKHRLLARLRVEGVRLSPEVQRRGVPFVVCLSQLKTAWPDLWDSLVEKARVEAA